MHNYTIKIVICDGVKGYRLWDPTTHKVVINRDVIFVEDKLQETRDDNPKCLILSESNLFDPRPNPWRKSMDKTQIK